MFNQFVLLKDIESPTLDEVLSQNTLYGKLDPSDISNLPNVNPNNFVNICNFVDYYQLIDETEFILNIQYHILRKIKEVTMNIHLIPLNLRQKVYQNECLTKMKCKVYDTKHIACYNILNKPYCDIDYASQNGYLEIIKYLFKIGRGKECSNWAIDWASGHGHFDVVKYLFEVAHKDCTTLAIDLASFNGHLDIVKYLFEVQHKECTLSAISFASQSGHLDIVKYLITVQHKKYTSHTINMARIHNHLEIVEYLNSLPDSFIE